MSAHHLLLLTDDTKNVDRSDDVEGAASHGGDVLHSPDHLHIELLRELDESGVARVNFCVFDVLGDGVVEEVA